MTCSPRSAFQRRCVVCHMLAKEAGNEVVAVVVAWAQIQRERVPRLVAGFAQQVGLKLALQELVAQALSTSNGKRSCTVRISSTVSYCFHTSRSLPRYASKALCPQGTWVGATMGEKAERSEEHTS